MRQHRIYQEIELIEVAVYEALGSQAGHHVHALLVYHSRPLQLSHLQAPPVFRRSVTTRCRGQYESACSTKSTLLLPNGKQLVAHAQSLVAENEQSAIVGLEKGQACLDKGECVNEAHEHRMPIAVDGFGYWKPMLLERCHECKLLQRRQPRQVQPAAGNESFTQPLKFLLVSMKDYAGLASQIHAIAIHGLQNQGAMLSRDTNLMSQILIKLLLDDMDARCSA